MKINNLFHKAKWRFLVDRSELNVKSTVLCGQSFMWEPENEREEYSCVIDDRVIFVAQDLDRFKEEKVELDSPHFSFLFKLEEKEEELAESIKEKLKDYFRLSLSFKDLMDDWKKRDKNFEKIDQKFHGIRLIRQNPYISLFSVICSQNNNIGRITKMVKCMCQDFGTEIAEYNDKKYFSFPTLEQMSKVKENDLKERKFGYRSSYIVSAAKYVKNKGGEKWVEEFRDSSYETAKTELTKIKGVGNKVFNCVALFSLDKLDAIPVDTHMFKIAQKYLPKYKNKKLSKIITSEIETHFKNLWGEYAGWAHTLLFSDMISVFKPKSEKKRKSTDKKSSTEKKKQKTVKKKNKKKQESEEDEDDDSSYDSDDYK